MTLQAAAFLVFASALAFWSLLAVGLLQVLLGRRLPIATSGAVVGAGAVLLWAADGSVFTAFQLSLALPDILYHLVLHAGRNAGFLIAPLACAMLSAVSVLYALRSRWRISVMGALTSGLLAFMLAFLGAGQVQHYYDVTRAAERQGIRCLNVGTLHRAIAISLGLIDFDYHAVGLKGDELQAWSFRKHNFYRVTKYSGAGPWNPDWFARRFSDCPHRPRFRGP